MSKIGVLYMHIHNIFISYTVYTKRECIYKLFSLLPAPGAGGAVAATGAAAAPVQVIHAYVKYTYTEYYEHFICSYTLYACVL